MASTVQQEVDERTNLTGSNKFELLLFRLGTPLTSSISELFGINVFKVREIVAMPVITPVVGAPQHTLGVVNLRGQIMPVLDLPSIVGFKPVSGLNIMLVTEYARSTQAFAVESVEDIVRLDWGQVLSAEQSHTAGLVTSIARLDGNKDGSRLAQVLDVEAILLKVMGVQPVVDEQAVGAKVKLKPCLLYTSSWGHAGRACRAIGGGGPRRHGRQCSRSRFCRGSAHQRRGAPFGHDAGH